MSLVEKDISKNNFEHFSKTVEYASRIESEQKFVATKPEVFEVFRSMALPIERQAYLSHPDEEFSLRVRKLLGPKDARYTATLKDRGQLENGQQHRLEIETDVDAATYKFYADRYPFIKKLRAEPAEGFVVDFMEGMPPIIEIETKNPVWREHLLGIVEHTTKEVTGDRTFDPETLAHRFNPREKSPPRESLDTFTERVVSAVLAEYVCGRDYAVVGLSGMSGSGKSTVTRAIEATLTERFGESYRPITLSTDDYHRGRTWLEDTYGAPWTNWDDPRVYDTEELARDIKLLKQGYPLIRRHFDFEKEEVVFDEQVPPSPFIVLEGLYAGSPDLNGVRNLHFELPTGVATSIGRDLRRLVIEGRTNRVFPTPEARLRYQLETALPAYINQERPRLNSFSACARPLASRAFMLEAYGSKPTL